MNAHSISLGLFREKMESAQKVLSAHVRHVELRKSSFLSRITGSEVFLKDETVQISGSCKIRSAGLKVLMHRAQCRKKGVVTASTGNNALAHAWLSRKYGFKCVVFLPSNQIVSDVREMFDNRLVVRLAGSDIVDAEMSAYEFANQSGMVYHPPYNDLEVIVGQGTIGKEISETNLKPDAVFAAAGGGGLISGVSLGLRAMGSKARVIGCVPRNATAIKDSCAIGKAVQDHGLDTIVSIAGGVVQDSITVGLCQQHVGEFVEVSEMEIKTAMLAMYEEEGIILEGAAALTVAALIARSHEYQRKRVVLCLCGRNIAWKRFIGAVDEARRAKPEARPSWGIWKNRM